MTILEIRSKLLDNSLNFSEAYELIKKLPKAWKTKEWAERKSKTIKKFCEQCGTSEGIMIIQHLVHPTEFSEIRNDLFSELFNEELEKVVLQEPTISNDEIEGFKGANSKKREACPFCNRLTFRERKTMKPKYYCEICKNYFEHTVEIEYIEIFKGISTDDAVYNYLFNKKKKEIFFSFKNEIYKKNESELGKKALLIAIEQHLRYMDFRDVVTFCKKCASKMDFNSSLLCWNCKKNYFNFEFDLACYSCFNEDKVVINPWQTLIFERRQENLDYNQKHIE